MHHQGGEQGKFDSRRASWCAHSCKTYWIPQWAVRQGWHAQMEVLKENLKKGYLRTVGREISSSQRWWDIQGGRRDTYLGRACESSTTLWVTKLLWGKRLGSERHGTWAELRSLQAAVRAWARSGVWTAPSCFPRAGVWMHPDLGRASRLLCLLTKIKFRINFLFSKSLSLAFPTTIQALFFLTKNLILWLERERGSAFVEDRGNKVTIIAVLLC